MNKEQALQKIKENEKKNYCGIKMFITVFAINGQTFFEKGEVRCGWWKNNNEKYQCKNCKNNLIK